MRDHEPTLPKWPFLVGDALLLGCAYFIYAQSVLPLGPRELSLGVVCIAGGAILAVIPFLLQYRGDWRLAESQGLTDAVAQIKNLEEVAANISGATSRWQFVQENADKTAAAAKALSDQMTIEVKAFSSLVQQSIDKEKETLRLEVEKLRRAESDWLQVVVRILDHVYALHQGALRSGQPNVADQIGRFQAACRDTVRRIGLTPFTGVPDELFTPEKHQVLKEAGEPGPEAKITETIATGFTYQGRLLRPALVRTDEPSAPRPSADVEPTKPSEVESVAGSTDNPKDS